MTVETARWAVFPALLPKHGQRGIPYELMKLRLKNQRATMSCVLAALALIFDGCSKSNTTLDQKQELHTTARPSGKYERDENGWVHRFNNGLVHIPTTNANSRVFLDWLDSSPHGPAIWLVKLDAHDDITCFTWDICAYADKPMLERIIALPALKWAAVLLTESITESDLKELEAINPKVSFQVEGNAVHRLTLRRLD